MRENESLSGLVTVLGLVIGSIALSSDSFALVAYKTIRELS